MVNFKQYIHIGTHELSVNIKEGDIGDILFIHGLGCSKESFDDVLTGEWFAGRRLIIPDLPGFGESSKPLEYSYSMNDQANILKKLLVHLGSEQSAIIAHSMGGAVGLILSEMLPSIESFFCLEGNLIAEDCFVSKKIAAKSESDFVNHIFPKNPIAFRCRQLKSDPAPSPVAYYRSCISLVEMSESEMLLKKFMTLHAPKTYIYGERNRNIKAISAVAGVEVLEIKGSGHFMHNDNPVQTYSEIERRLTEK